MRDFRDRTYAATTEREDMAVHEEYYVMGAERFRRDVRAAMQDGNFAPAAKYLFMKYLFFLDGDGISFEYSISPSGQLINFEGVLNAMQPVKCFRIGKVCIRMIVDRDIYLI